MSFIYPTGILQANTFGNFSFIANVQEIDSVIAELTSNGVTDTYLFRLKILADSIKNKSHFQQNEIYNYISTKSLECSEDVKFLVRHGLIMPSTLSKNEWLKHHQAYHAHQTYHPYHPYQAWGHGQAHQLSKWKFSEVRTAPIPSSFTSMMNVTSSEPKMYFSSNAEAHYEESSKKRKYSHHNHHEHSKREKTHSSYKWNSSFHAQYPN